MSWSPAGAPRTIARALLPAERAAVEARVASLAASLAPFTDEERDDVEIEIGIMIGGFRSMRQEGAAAQAIVRVISAIVEEFPPWAIARGCRLIESRKTGFLDPPMNPEFPPNDCRIYEVVEHVITPYRRALIGARALLAAPVEPPEQPKPSREEIEAMLGRPVARFGLRDGDGKHAERVAADLALRRAVEVATDG